MPHRGLEKQLYRQLKESEFSFIPRGVQNIRDIYHFVNTQFPELCDNEFKCSDWCRSNAISPEWNHIVRGVLGNSSRVVRKAAGRGNWEFF